MGLFHQQQCSSGRFVISFNVIDLHLRCSSAGHHVLRSVARIDASSLPQHLACHAPLTSRLRRVLVEQVWLEQLEGSP